MATSVLEKEVTTNVAVAEQTITVCGMAGQIAPLGSGHVHLSAFTGVAVREKPVERSFVGGMAGYVYPCPHGSPENAQTRIFGLGNTYR